MLTRRQASTPAEDYSATHIGQDIVIDGKLQGQGVLRIEGKVVGEIDHGGTVVVGERALVQATVRVKELVVHGRVEGKIEAERCEILATAHVEGELKAGRITVAEGAVILGQWAVTHASAPE